MKNLGLLFVLLGLIVFTYYYEEVKGINDQAVEVNKHKLIKDFRDFSSLKTPKYTIKKNQNWSVENLNYPASEKLVKDLEHIFSSINIVSEVVSTIDSGHFKQTELKFTLTIGGLNSSYVLGDVSNLTGHFAIKRLVDNKVFICQDDSRFTGTYKTDLDQSLQKYVRLKAILNGPDDLFIERNLFQHLDINKLSKVKIDNKHNRWFELDLVKNESKPSVMKSLKYKKIKEVISFLIEKATVQKLITNGQNILSNPVSEIVLTIDNKEVLLKLYAGLNGNYGHYAKFKTLDYIFMLNEETSHIFHTHVQDYWNKKFLLDIDFKNIKSFDFELAIGKGKSYPFRVDDIEKFTIDPLDKKVSSINKNLMNFLFNLVFNLVDFKEASYVETVSVIEDYQLSLKLFKRDFGIRILDNKIEVVDKVSMIKYHFNYNTQQLKTDTVGRIFTVTSK